MKPSAPIASSINEGKELRLLIITSILTFFSSFALYAYHRNLIVNVVAIRQTINNVISLHA